MNATATPLQSKPARRYDLDWLRIAAVFLLVPFHSALIFNLDPHAIVYIKDTINSPTLNYFAGFLNLWHMPLLFCIAGASSWLALSFRSAWKYLGERCLRLLLPAGFGLVTLIPAMTYIHFIGQPGAPAFLDYYSGFFRINPADLAGLGGTFTPAHLWFIIFLFFFSVIALPLFVLLRKTGVKPAASLLGGRGGLALLTIPLALAAAVNLLGDKNPVYYGLVFILGYLLMGDNRFQLAIDRDWLLYLGLSVVGTGVYFGIGGNPFPNWTWQWIAAGLLENYLRWGWVLAILGAGHRFLNVKSAALSYAAEAAFPFYILHMPINTLVGFFVIRMGTSVAVKYTLIVVLTTLLTAAVYALVVRPILPLRFLMGVKVRKISSQ